MTRTKTDETAAMFRVPAHRGRVERSVDLSIRAARRAGTLTDLDAGACALARSLARGVDEAEDRRSARQRADCARELREVLASLGLQPASRGELRRDDSGADPWDDLVRAMGSATAPDQP